MRARRRGGHRARLESVNGEGHDRALEPAGVVHGHAIERAEPLAQVGGQRHDPLGDPLDADLQRVAHARTPSPSRPAT